MEKILEEILKELQFQTKLLESLSLNQDERKFNAAMAKGQIKSMMANLSSHPIFKENPIMAGAMTQMFDGLMKGVKNEQ